MNLRRLVVSRRRRVNEAGLLKGGIRVSHLVPSL